MELRDVLSRPYPVIETRNGRPVLRLDENVFLLLPPLDSPVALASYKTRLSPEIRRDYEIARFKKHHPRAEPSDIAELLEALTTCTP